MLDLLRHHPGDALGGLAFGVALVGVIAALVIRFPTFDGAPAVPRAGEPFTVDASVAAAGLRAPVRYEWDLDDDRTRADGFERATGETKEISKLVHVDR